MTGAQLRGAIERTLDQMPQGGAHSYSDLAIAHTDGLLRGLLWALTGKDPGNYITSDMARVCQLADISYRIDGDIVYYGVGHK